MKARLRREYYGLGGAPNQVRLSWPGRRRTLSQFATPAPAARLPAPTPGLHPCASAGSRGTSSEFHPALGCSPCLQKMGNNYFLIIILVISALAVASKLTGAI